MLLALAVLCLSNAARFSHVRAQDSSQPASPFALTPLQRQIESERARLKLFDVEERRDAVQRLGAIARPESSRAASVALGDRAAIVRATAAQAVLSLPAAEAAGLLIPLLGDKDEFVRRETAYALGATKSRAAVSTLMVVLARDKSAAVRGAAAVALGQIGDATASPQLAQALNARIRGTGLVSRVTRSKTEENEFVRRAAAVALGQIASRDAVPALISTLANERAGDDVRREAARALGLIGDVSAIPALRAALTARDPYLSQIAREALRKLDPANAARPT
jgi:HEAT repeat protein